MVTLRLNFSAKSAKQKPSHKKVRFANVPRKMLKFKINMMSSEFNLLSDFSVNSFYCYPDSQKFTILRIRKNMSTGNNQKCHL